MSQLAKNIFPETYTPQVFPSQNEVCRYWDPILERRAAKLKPGEFCFTASNELLVTVSGSSLVVCVRDKLRRLAGMTHFILPATGHSTIDVTTTDLVVEYGRKAMSGLLDCFYRLGSRPNAMDATLVGGGKIWQPTSDYVDRTLGFGRFYLGKEGIRIGGEFVGGTMPKKIYFSPDESSPRVELLKTYTPTIRDREEYYLRSLRSDWILGYRRTSMKFTGGAARPRHLRPKTTR
ncbi:MAG: hypothetical protein VYA34_14610 [Myxococcota bacterium]|nr:hypothetical protein [Myxococcota bacterium]